MSTRQSSNHTSSSSSNNNTSSINSSIKKLSSFNTKQPKYKCICNNDIACYGVTTTFHLANDKRGCFVELPPTEMELAVAAATESRKPGRGRSRHEHQSHDQQQRRQLEQALCLRGAYLRHLNVDDSVFDDQDQQGAYYVALHHFPPEVADNSLRSEEFPRIATICRTREAKAITKLYDTDQEKVMNEFVDAEGEEHDDQEEEEEEEEDEQHDVDADIEDRVPGTLNAIFVVPNYPFEKSQIDAQRTFKTALMSEQLELIKKNHHGAENSTSLPSSITICGGSVTSSTTSITTNTSLSSATHSKALRQEHQEQQPATSLAAQPRKTPDTTSAFAATEDKPSTGNQNSQNVIISSTLDAPQQNVSGQRSKKLHQEQQQNIGDNKEADAIERPYEEAEKQQRHVDTVNSIQHTRSNSSHSQTFDFLLSSFTSRSSVDNLGSTMPANTNTCSARTGPVDLDDYELAGSSIALSSTNHKQNESKHQNLQKQHCTETKEDNHNGIYVSWPIDLDDFIESDDDDDSGVKSVEKNHYDGPIGRISSDQNSNLKEHNVPTLREEGNAFDPLDVPEKSRPRPKLSEAAPGPIDLDISWSVSSSEDEQDKVEAAAEGGGEDQNILIHSSKLNVPQNISMKDSASSFQDKAQAKADRRKWPLDLDLTWSDSESLNEAETKEATRSLSTPNLCNVSANVSNVEDSLKIMDPAAVSHHRKLTMAAIKDPRDEKWSARTDYSSSSLVMSKFDIEDNGSLITRESSSTKLFSMYPDPDELNLGSHSIGDTESESDKVSLVSATSEDEEISKDLPVTNSLTSAKSGKEEEEEEEVEPKRDNKNVRNAIQLVKSEEEPFMQSSRRRRSKREKDFDLDSNGSSSVSQCKDLKHAPTKPSENQSFEYTGLQKSSLAESNKPEIKTLTADSRTEVKPVVSEEECKPANQPGGPTSDDRAKMIDKVEDQEEPTLYDADDGKPYKPHIASTQYSAPSMKPHNNSTPCSATPATEIAMNSNETFEQLTYRRQYDELSGLKVMKQKRWPMLLPRPPAFESAKRLTFGDVQEDTEIECKLLNDMDEKSDHGISVSVSDIDGIPYRRNQNIWSAYPIDNSKSDLKPLLLKIDKTEEDTSDLYRLHVPPVLDTIWSVDESEIESASEQANESISTESKAAKDAKSEKPNRKYEYKPTDSDRPKITNIMATERRNLGISQIEKQRTPVLEDSSHNENVNDVPDLTTNIFPIDWEADRDGKFEEPHPLFENGEKSLESSKIVEEMSSREEESNDDVIKSVLCEELENKESPSVPTITKTPPRPAPASSVCSKSDPFSGVFPEEQTSQSGTSTNLPPGLSPEPPTSVIIVPDLPLPKLPRPPRPKKGASCKPKLQPKNRRPPPRPTGALSGSDTESDVMSEMTPKATNCTIRKKTIKNGSDTESEVTPRVANPRQKSKAIFSAKKNEVEAKPTENNTPKKVTITKEQTRRSWIRGFAAINRDNVSGSSWDCISSDFWDTITGSVCGGECLPAPE